MGIIENFINNKIITRKKDKFFKNIRKLIEEREKQESGLYQFNTKVMIGN